MPARAFENGTWVAAADKWGTEADSIVYAGRSTVIDPSGVTRVCAPGTGNAVVTYRVEPMVVDTLPRRPALYRDLVKPTAGLRAVELQETPVAPAASGGRVAVVPGKGEWDAGWATRRFAALRAQGCDVVVFGGEPGMEGWEVSLPVVEQAVRERGGVAVVSVFTNACHWRQSAAIVTPDKTIEHVATHGRSLEVGETPAQVVETAAGNLGVLVGEEAFVPEVARCLALNGADLLAWTAFEGHEMAERLARTRADENKVYVAAAYPGGGLVSSPDGALLTAVPAGLDVAMSAPVNIAQSRYKERAPGTDVIRNRIPEAYAALVR
jgi:predicted amidohydrolase